MYPYTMRSAWINYDDVLTQAHHLTVYVCPEYQTASERGYNILGSQTSRDVFAIGAAWMHWDSAPSVRVSSVLENFMILVSGRRE